MYSNLRVTFIVKANWSTSHINITQRLLNLKVEWVGLTHLFSQLKTPSLLVSVFIRLLHLCFISLSLLCMMCCYRLKSVLWWWESAVQRRQITIIIPISPHTKVTSLFWNLKYLNNAPEDTRKIYFSTSLVTSHLWYILYKHSCDHAYTQHPVLDQGNCK